MTNTSPTITIIGAGLVGAAAALALQSLSVPIILFDRRHPTAQTSPMQDARPISLSYGSVRVLQSLGVWDAIEKFSCPILTVHVSEKGRFGVTRFTAQEQKIPALGYVVPFGYLQSALYQKALSAPHLQFQVIEKINAIMCHDDHAEINMTIDNIEKNIKTNLCIAADGTESTCRMLLNIATIEEDHHDHALIYECDLAQPHHYTAYERFTQQGVLAILPLYTDKKARLVWTITPRIAKKIKLWDDAQTLAFLQDVFYGRLNILTIKKTGQFPLKTVLAETHIRPSAVLIGNAAHTIYPIAAQGFNLGLHNLRILQKILMEAQYNKQRLGDPMVLKNYAEKIKKHQQVIIQLTNHLSPLFELQIPFLGHTRGAGLFIMDFLQPFKNKLAKYTMGI